MHNEKGEYNDNDDEKEYGSNKKTCKLLISEKHVDRYIFIIATLTSREKSDFQKSGERVFLLTSEKVGKNFFF